MNKEVQETLKDILSHPHWVEMKSADSDQTKFVIRGHIALGKNFKMRRTIKVENADIETKRWIEIFASLSHPLMVLIPILAIIPGVFIFGSFLDQSPLLFSLGLISAGMVGYMEFHVMELRKSLEEICKMFKDNTKVPQITTN